MHNVSAVSFPRRFSNSECLFCGDACLSQAQAQSTVVFTFHGDFSCLFSEKVLEVRNDDILRLWIVPYGDFGIEKWAVIP